MTNKKFWNIADEYEEIDRKGQSYVPAKNIKKLVAAVFEANKHDYDESLADLNLFNFKISFDKVVKELNNLKGVK